MNDREHFRHMLVEASLVFEERQITGADGTTLLIPSQYEGFVAYWRFSDDGKLLSTGVFTT